MPTKKFHRLDCLSTNKKSFSITPKKKFNELVDLSPYVERCLDFAYQMTIGGVGEHRNHRSGGSEHRDYLQQFQNVLQEKLAEFGFYDFIVGKGFMASEPDLNAYEEGIWDDVDLTVNHKRISVKSSSFIAQLLLLEKEDWDENGFYKPNHQHEADCYDYFVFCRIKPDSKTVFNKEELGDDWEIDHLKTIAKASHWVMDIPGCISRKTLVALIKKKFILPKGALLNGKTEMDADNNYCQAGDLWDLDILLNNLR